MSPKGHFCTLSLLRRNKAASWDEPKKKRGGKPPTHPSSATFDVCTAGSMQAQASLATASSSSNCTRVQIIRHCLPISFKPHRNFIHCETWTPDTPNGKRAGLSLNTIWRWPRKKKREKTFHVHCLGFSATFAEYIAVYLNKGFRSPWRDERGTSPFTSESRDAHTALLWNTTSLVPCSRVCSSNGALRRPICLADHCLFDVAANVTFLFQSKTQQGVPSVWHSLPSLPWCLFVQIILHGNLHGSFIPWFW